MPYLNLKAEMARRDVLIEEIAHILGIHRNSVHFKLNKGNRFYVDEAITIHQTFFKDLEFAELFRRE